MALIFLTTECFIEWLKVMVNIRPAIISDCLVKIYAIVKQKQRPMYAFQFQSKNGHFTDRCFLHLSHKKKRNREFGGNEFIVCYILFDELEILMILQELKRITFLFGRSGVLLILLKIDSSYQIYRLSVVWSIALTKL